MFFEMMTRPERAMFCLMSLNHSRLSVSFEQVALVPSLDKIPGFPEWGPFSKPVAVMTLTHGFD